MEKTKKQQKRYTLHAIRYTEDGFTLIELIVSVAIIAILSLIVLFSVAQYTNKGKDSNVQGNLAVLIPAGEAFYNGENAANGDGYTGFCASSAITNIYAQLSLPATSSSAWDCSASATPGLCCLVDSAPATAGTEWAACAQEFTDNTKAFCVDSTGARKEIANSECATISQWTLMQCPSN